MEHRITIKFMQVADAHWEKGLGGLLHCYSRESPHFDCRRLPKQQQIKIRLIEWNETQNS